MRKFRWPGSATTARPTRPASGLASIATAGPACRTTAVVDRRCSGSAAADRRTNRLRPAHEQRAPSRFGCRSPTAPVFAGHVRSKKDVGAAVGHRRPPPNRQPYSLSGLSTLVALPGCASCGRRVVQQANSVAPPPPVVPLGAIPTIGYDEPAAGSGDGAAGRRCRAAKPPVVRRLQLDPPAGPPALALPGTPATELAPAGPRRPRRSLNSGLPAEPPAARTQGPKRTGRPIETQHVRDKTVAIDFDVDRKGPVRRQEDRGLCHAKTTARASVQVLRIDEYHAAAACSVYSPAMDGLYGFCMVLYSGVGQTEGPPRAGDPPCNSACSSTGRCRRSWGLYEPVLDPMPAELIEFAIRYKAADANPRCPVPMVAVLEVAAGPAVAAAGRRRDAAPVGPVRGRAGMLPGRCRRTCRTASTSGSPLAIRPATSASSSLRDAVTVDLE